MIATYATNFTTAQQLIAQCDKSGIGISEAMLRREMEVFNKSREDIIGGLEHSLDIMRDGVREALAGGLRSIGGLIGGEAALLNERIVSGKSICGPFVSKAATYAMGILEVNSSMGLIVAAPTAGSSGVLPGVLLACEEGYGLSGEQLIDALLNAAAIGYLIARNATISGAQGGCQAEIGAASAMAASALVQIMGGSASQCVSAASTALGNILGLVCDPVAGLVEEPCQKRNAMGAANAIVSAELALSGIRSIIPLDEMIDAMYSVGRSLPFELRESGLGGIAGTCTGCSLRGRIFGA